MNDPRDRCLICNHIFNESEGEDDNGIVSCPNCGSTSLVDVNYNIYTDDTSYDDYEDGGVFA